MAEALLTALKPEKFCVSKKGDPDILLTEFNEYVKKFERFTKACNLDQGHVPGEDGEHVGCATCGRLVAMFECVGQDEIQVLLEHVGKVEEGDSWNTTKTKVKEAIMRQTNKASAVFKLFMEIPQEDLTFGEWYPKIEKQADRVTWEDIGREDAIVLEILYQSNSFNAT